MYLPIVVALLEYESCFPLQISLKKLGQQEWEKVVAATFCYLAMLKSAGPQEWVFEELRDIFNMQFQFQEEEDFDEFAVEVANNLRLVDPRHVLCKDYIFEVCVTLPNRHIFSNYRFYNSEEDPVLSQELDKSLIQELLNHLSPQLLRIDICTKPNSNSELEYQMHEEWFGIQYSEDRFSESQQSLWESAYNSPSGALPELSNLELGLPPRNLFIPTDFSIVDIPSEEKPAIIFQNAR